MRSSTLHGIVLKRTNYGEADKVVTVFSDELGKLNLVAKGIRRINSRRAPHLELFNYVSLTTHHGKFWDLITEAKKINGPVAPSGYLFYLAEVLDKILPERVPHPEIYRELLKIIGSVDENSAKVFVIKSLWNLGYLPTGEYPKTSVTEFVESVVERKIKSRKFVDKI